MSQRGASFRHKFVSKALRALRHKRGLSCKDVADALGFSEAKVSRMETGDRGLDPDDVAAVLGFLRAPLKDRQDLIGLVRAGQTKSWQVLDTENKAGTTGLRDLERLAKSMFNYESAVIPGLGQTAEYTRALVRGANPALTEAQVDAAVAARMSRQAILGRVELVLLIEEAALRRTLGDPNMMRCQLRHLLTLMSRRHVTVQAVPHSAPAHAGLTGPFLILDFADQGSLVYTEGRGSATFLEDSVLVAAAKTVWSNIRAVALSAEETAQLVGDILEGLT